MRVQIDKSRFEPERQEQHISLIVKTVMRWLYWYHVAATSRFPGSIASGASMTKPVFRAMDRKRRKQAA